MHRLVRPVALVCATVALATALGAHLGGGAAPVTASAASVGGIRASAIGTWHVSGGVTVANPRNACTGNTITAGWTATGPWVCAGGAARFAGTGIGRLRHDTGTPNHSITATLTPSGARNAGLVVASGPSGSYVATWTNSGGGTLTLWRADAAGTLTQLARRTGVASSNTPRVMTLTRNTAGVTASFAGTTLSYAPKAIDAALAAQTFVGLYADNDPSTLFSAIEASS